MDDSCSVRVLAGLLVLDLRVAGSWWRVMGMLTVIFVKWVMAEMSGLGWIKASSRLSSPTCWVMSWMTMTAAEAETMTEDTLQEIDDLTGFNVILLEVGVPGSDITILVGYVDTWQDKPLIRVKIFEARRLEESMNIMAIAVTGRWDSRSWWQPDSLDKASRATKSTTCFQEARVE